MAVAGRTVTAPDVEEAARLVAGRAASSLADEEGRTLIPAFDAGRVKGAVHGRELVDAPRGEGFEVRVEREP